MVDALRSTLESLRVCVTSAEVAVLLDNME
jgi:hypothetical protein